MTALPSWLPVKQFEQAANWDLVANRRVIEPPHDFLPRDLPFLSDGLRLWAFSLALCSAR